MHTTFIYTADLFGVAVFAVSGALAAGRKRLDLFGVLVLALATALGGGTLRDLILGVRPVFWVLDPLYIYVASGAAVGTFAAVRIVSHHPLLLKAADAFGLAVFTAIGTGKGLEAGAAPAIAVLTGIMTGVAGGMVRDVLTGEIPLILRQEIYATASLGGGVALILLAKALPAPWPFFLSCLVTLGLRLAAIHWRLSLPLLTLGPDRK